MNAPTPSTATTPRATEGSAVCGGFTLERLLRRDEVVSVYLARAAGDSYPRHVAHVVHGVRAADEGRAAAFDEAAALLQELRHRAIPRVVAAAVVGVEPVVVCERVHATTLRDLARDPQGLDPQELALALLRVAEVLDALHARAPAVVHRRLCPDNVLVSGAGEVWVEQCGLAHALVEAGWSPMSVAPAAPEYLTPQEALHRIHPQTDVFALATIAYECLTGSAPFAGDPAVIRAAVLERERPSAAALRPDLSRNVDAVLLRAWSSEGCGALEPYASAEALARELLRVLDVSVRVTSPHSITMPPTHAATVPPYPPEDLPPMETPVRVKGPRVDDDPDEPPPAEVEVHFLRPQDVDERASTVPSGDLPLAEEPAVSDAPVASSAAPSEDVLTAPPAPLATSAVQTIPGVGAAPSESAPPEAPSGEAAPAVPDSPPADPAPPRAEDAPTRAPMSDPPRPIFPNNFGPSLVAAAAILAAAWIYTQREAPPPPTQQVSPLRAEPPSGALPEVRPPETLAPTPPAPTPPAPTPPAPTPPALTPPEPTVIADAAPAPLPTAPDAAVVVAPAAIDAGVRPPPGRPPEGELRAIRTMLEPVVQECLAQTPVRVLRVMANYQGSTGRPRVALETAVPDIEAAACVERAVLNLTVRRFGPGSWPVRYTFNVR